MGENVHKRLDKASFVLGKKNGVIRMKTNEISRL